LEWHEISFGWLEKRVYRLFGFLEILDMLFTPDGKIFPGVPVIFWWAEDAVTARLARRLGQAKTLTAKINP
jgi:hypothetical protein